MKLFGSHKHAGIVTFVLVIGGALLCWGAIYLAYTHLLLVYD